MLEFSVTNTCYSNVSHHMVVSILVGRGTIAELFFNLGKTRYLHLLLTKLGQGYLVCLVEAIEAPALRGTQLSKFMTCSLIT